MVNALEITANDIESIVKGTSSPAEITEAIQKFPPPPIHS